MRRVIWARECMSCDQKYVDNPVWRLATFAPPCPYIGNFWVTWCSSSASRKWNVTTEWGLHAPPLANLLRGPLKEYTIAVLHNGRCQISCKNWSWRTQDIILRQISSSPTLPTMQLDCQDPGMNVRSGSSLTLIQSQCCSLWNHKWLNKNIWTKMCKICGLAL